MNPVEFVTPDLIRAFRSVPDEFASDAMRFVLNTDMDPERASVVANEQLNDLYREPRAKILGCLDRGECKEEFKFHGYDEWFSEFVRKTLRREIDATGIDCCLNTDFQEVEEYVGSYAPYKRTTYLRITIYVYAEE